MSRRLRLQGDYPSVLYKVVKSLTAGPALLSACPVGGLRPAEADPALCLERGPLHPLLCPPWDMVPPLTSASGMSGSA